VRDVWIPNGLKTRRARLLRLTEEQIQAFERFDPEFRERHSEVHATADEVVKAGGIPEANPQTLSQVWSGTVVCPAS